VKLAAVAALIGALQPWGIAQAQTGGCEAIVVSFDGAELPDLLGVPEFESLAVVGGVALMNGRSDAVEELRDVADRVAGEPGLCLTEMEPGSGPADAPSVVASALADTTSDDVLVIVLSGSPGAASAAEGDELGTVILARGDPATLLEASGEPRALTSDSTRRPGVVADVDPAATVADRLDLPSDAGAPIETTEEPAPLDLYERYLQQRRLAVPAAAVSWGFVALAGLGSVLALGFRRRLSGRTLWIAGLIPASVPWLALGLLWVGHLPSLTATTVVPTILLIIVVGVAFTRRVAARRGIFVATAACGGVILLALAVEAAVGWPAAVTPLAGGGQLDGGRFFGMPNIEIGIVLGAALFVAHRVRVRTGVLLLLACALVAGSPWTGSNFGASITLSAAAGLWWGIRRRRPWWAVVLIAGLVTAAGTAVVALMHRYLVERATHVTTFLESGDGVFGAIERQLERLQVGLDLIVDSPFALIPVVGTLALLVVVLRPPGSIARSFEGHDAWRDAVLVIVLGSIVAYLAEDTGAAALGFGFGFALAGLLDVSLAVAREKMTR
jgi:hypothetical protein